MENLMPSKNEQKVIDAYSVMFWSKLRKPTMYEVDDFKSMGYFVFIKAKEKYNKSKMKFTSFLIMLLSQYFINILKKENKFIKFDIEKILYNLAADEEEKSDWNYFLGYGWLKYNDVEMIEKDRKKLLGSIGISFPPSKELEEIESNLFNPAGDKRECMLNRKRDAFIIAASNFGYKADKVRQLKREYKNNTEVI